MKLVYIIHGYKASADHHWFGWLKNELGKRNITAIILSMPNSENPLKDEWVSYLQKNIIIGRNTFIVAHSLGCIATLLFINKTNAKIGGFIGVSGFDEKLKGMPDLDNFIDNDIVYEKIIANVSKRIVFASPEDYIVPFQLSEKLAKDIKAPLISVPNAGHFMADDGYVSFPELLKEIKKIIE
ncbi:MAG: alpha/beta hydrolase [Arachidicoccus sp.]|nr:alpha/beta hydrolase [Arachidicoccus sp.]